MALLSFWNGTFCVFSLLFWWSKQGFWVFYYKDFWFFWALANPILLCWYKVCCSSFLLSLVLWSVLWSIKSPTVESLKGNWTIAAVYRFHLIWSHLKPSFVPLREAQRMITCQRQKSVDLFCHLINDRCIRSSKTKLHLIWIVFCLKIPLEWTMPTNTFQCQSHEWWLRIQYTVKPERTKAAWRKKTQRTELFCTQWGVSYFRALRVELSPVSRELAQQCRGQHLSTVIEEAWNLDECTRIFQILLLSKQRSGCGGVFKCVHRVSKEI